MKIRGFSCAYKNSHVVPPLLQPTNNRQSQSRQESQRREDAAYAFLLSMGFSHLQGDKNINPKAQQVEASQAASIQAETLEMEIAPEASIMISMPPAKSVSWETKKETAVAAAAVGRSEATPFAATAAAVVTLRGAPESAPEGSRRSGGATAEGPTGMTRGSLAHHTPTASESGYGPIRPRINIEVRSRTEGRIPSTLDDYWMTSIQRPFGLRSPQSYISPSWSSPCLAVPCDWANITPLRCSSNLWVSGSRTACKCSAGSRGGSLTARCMRFWVPADQVSGQHSA